VVHCLDWVQRMRSEEAKAVTKMGKTVTTPTVTQSPERSTRSLLPVNTLANFSLVLAFRQRW
jgi:hypothetical protein